MYTIILYYKTSNKSLCLNKLVCKTALILIWMWDDLATPLCWVRELSVKNYTWLDKIWEIKCKIDFLFYVQAEQIGKVFCPRKNPVSEITSRKLDSSWIFVVSSDFQLEYAWFIICIYSTEGQCLQFKSDSRCILTRFPHGILPQPNQQHKTKQNNLVGVVLLSVKKSHFQAT